MVTPYGDIIWVDIGTGNGLLHDSTELLPELVLINSSKVFCGIHLRAVSQEVLMNLIHNMCSEITLKNHYHLSQEPMS